MREAILIHIGQAGVQMGSYFGIYLRLLVAMFFAVAATVVTGPADLDAPSAGVIVHLRRVRDDCQDGFPAYGMVGHSPPATLLCTRRRPRGIHGDAREVLQR